MVDDHLIASDEPDRFLDQLLRFAFTAPGASTSPTAGRILARLLAVGAVEGGDDFITPYLVPSPGEEATFEVRTYDPGDLVPMEVREGLRAAAALKIALRSARDSHNGIEVVSVTSSGLERCVLVRDSTGDFEFRFAAPETMTGAPELCAAAFAGWAEVLAAWREGVEREGVEREGVEREDTGSESAAEAAFAPARGAPRVGHPAWEARQGEQDDDPSPVTGTGWWAPITGVDEADRPEVGATEADHALPSSAPPEPDSPVSAGVGLAPESARPHERVGQEEAIGAGGGSGADAAGDELNTALRKVISDLVVEVDLGQVEQLIRRVIDDDRREMVDPLARRISARLEESLRLHDARALVDAVSEVLPRPADFAEAVASDIGALLSETVLRRRPGDAGTGMDASALMGGIERLHVRVDSLEDQFRKTSGMLHVLGEHLEVSDRRAAIAERITRAVDQEMQRLANRIDEQVVALAATAGGGSELSDGVARLTRKMRQSVIELDRAVARVDEVMNLLGGERGRQAGLARGTGPADGPAARRPPNAPGVPRPSSPR